MPTLLTSFGDELEKLAKPIPGMDSNLADAKLVYKGWSAAANFVGGGIGRRYAKEYLGAKSILKATNFRDIARRNRNAAIRKARPTPQQVGVKARKVALNRASMGEQITKQRAAMGGDITKQPIGKFVKKQFGPIAGGVAKSVGNTVKRSNPFYGVKRQWRAKPMWKPGAKRSIAGNTRAELEETRKYMAENG